MPHKRFQTCHAQGVIDADLSRSRRGNCGKMPFMDGNYLTPNRPGRQEPFREPILKGTNPLQNRTAFHQIPRLSGFVQRSFPAKQKRGRGISVY